MKVKIVIAFCFALLITTHLKAQSLAKLRVDAMELFTAGKYRQALVLLKQCQQMKGDDWDVLRAMGISAYHANQLPLTKQMLNAVVENDRKADPSVYLYLGKTFHAEQDFKMAVKAYKEFLRRAKADDPNRRTVVADIKRCASGLKIILQPELGLVENLGENVNSLHDEFAPIQSPNFDEKVYFSSNREDSDGGLRNDEGIVDAKNGTYKTDIYSTVLDNGDWVTPERLENGLINTSRQEVLLDFTNNGKTLYFFRGLTQYSGEILIDTFKSDAETRGLPPAFQSPIKAEESDNSMYFFNDSIIVFASRRAGGFGGSDLYYTVLSEGAWRTPVNLGNVINSPYDETTPYLAKDGRTLYFSSNSTASMGGFDVFRTTFNEDSLRFLRLENLGKPVNSAGDDKHFRLTPDGMKGYFSSNRKDGYGERDIYNAIFKNFQKEQTPSFPVAFYLIETFKNANPIVLDNKPKIAEFRFSPIFYDTDDDILRGVNLQQVKSILALIKQFPTLKVILTTNTTEGEKTSFDLYFATKRAEKIAKYLIDNGLQNENIALKSVGALYPVAKIFIDGNPNPAGEKMNRRIDIAIANATNEAVKITYDAPTVSQFMVDLTGDKYKKHTKGLSYKVQVQTTKRIFDADVLSRYPDAMMEASGTEAVYQYTVGLFTDFVSAEKLRKDLVKEGVRDAWVVPYVDGLRTIGEEAKRFTNRYGDLVNYLAAKKKP
jgi:outer membrane protein OmpA-like peptidoglycan-associated protein/tetratricopeptide (TPR) repeat protein